MTAAFMDSIQEVAIGADDPEDLINIEMDDGVALNGFRAPETLFTTLPADFLLTGSSSEYNGARSGLTLTADGTAVAGWTALTNANKGNSGFSGNRIDGVMSGGLAALGHSTTTGLNGDTHSVAEDRSLQATASIVAPPAGTPVIDHAINARANGQTGSGAPPRVTFSASTVYALAWNVDSTHTYNPAIGADAVIPGTAFHRPLTTPTAATAEPDSLLLFVAMITALVGFGIVHRERRHSSPGRVT
jgi:hypothetical protein